MFPPPRWLALATGEMVVQLSPPAALELARQTPALMIVSLPEPFVVLAPWSTVIVRDNGLKWAHGICRCRHAPPTRTFDAKWNLPELNVIVSFKLVLLYNGPSHLFYFSCLRL